MSSSIETKLAQGMSDFLISSLGAWSERASVTGRFSVARRRMPEGTPTVDIVIFLAEMLKDQGALRVRTAFTTAL